MAIDMKTKAVKWSHHVYWKDYVQYFEYFGINSCLYQLWNELCKY